MSLLLLWMPMFLLLCEGESLPFESSLSVVGSSREPCSSVRASCVTCSSLVNSCRENFFLPPITVFEMLGGTPFCRRPTLRLTPRFGLMRLVRGGYSYGLPSVSWILFFESRVEALTVTDRSRSMYSCSGSCLESLRDLLSGLFRDFSGCWTGSFWTAAAGTKSW